MADELDCNVYHEEVPVESRASRATVTITYGQQTIEASFLLEAYPAFARLLQNGLDSDQLQMIIDAGSYSVQQMHVSSTTTSVSSPTIVSPTRQTSYSNDISNLCRLIDETYENVTMLDSEFMVDSCKSKKLIIGGFTILLIMTDNYNLIRKGIVGLFNDPSSPDCAIILSPEKEPRMKQFNTYSKILIGMGYDADNKQNVIIALDIGISYMNHHRKLICAAELDQLTPISDKFKECASEITKHIKRLRKQLDEISESEAKMIADIHSIHEKMKENVLGTLRVMSSSHKLLAPPIPKSVKKVTIAVESKVQSLEVQSSEDKSPEDKCSKCHRSMGSAAALKKHQEKCRIVRFLCSCGTEVISHKNIIAHVGGGCEKMHLDDTDCIAKIIGATPEIDGVIDITAGLTASN
jgi:hypothetical protein